MRWFHRKQQKEILYLIESSYWRGFFDALQGKEDEECSWKYTSPEGGYQYNPIHQRAYALGVRRCLEILRSRRSGRPWITDAQHEVPQAVYDECLSLSVR